MCTQAEVDRLRERLEEIETSGGVVRTRHGDRDTQWAPPSDSQISAIRDQLARAERCLYMKINGRYPPKLFRGQHRKGLR